MDTLDRIFNELNKETGNKIVSLEAFEKAEKEINEKLRKFSIEHQEYLNRSAQSARTAYLNF